MNEGKQGFAAAEYGQDFCIGVDGQSVVTALQPVGTGLTQLGQTCGQGVFFQFVQVRRSAIGDDFGGRVFRFADVKVDGGDAFGRVNALHGFAQAGKRIGLELVE